MTPDQSLNNAKQTIVKLWNIDPSKYDGKLESEITVNINVKDLLSFWIRLCSLGSDQVNQGSEEGSWVLSRCLHPGQGNMRLTKVSSDSGLARYITENQEK